MKITITYIDGEEQMAGILRRFASHILDDVKVGLSPRCIEVQERVFGGKDACPND